MNSTEAEHDLTVIPLNAKGQPGEPAGHADLAGPQGMGKAVVQALTVVAHPEKPLIYVWQDVVASEENPPNEEAAQEYLDHLLVYEITSDHKLKLVQSTGAARRMPWAAAAGR